jgi:hypothetical protein
MEPNAFIAEGYRRMAMRNKPEAEQDAKKENIIDTSIARKAVFQYKSILPKERNSIILDIGYRNGWFIGVCIKLGYTNIYGVDYGAERKQYIYKMVPEC